MNCRKCEAQLKEKTSYCPFCGTKLVLTMSDLQIKEKLAELAFRKWTERQNFGWRLTGLDTGVWELAMRKSGLRVYMFGISNRLHEPTTENVLALVDETDRIAKELYSMLLEY